MVRTETFECREREEERGRRRGESKGRRERGKEKRGRIEK